MKLNDLITAYKASQPAVSSHTQPVCQLSKHTVPHIYKHYDVAQGGLSTYRPQYGKHGRKVRDLANMDIPYSKYEEDVYERIALTDVKRLTAASKNGSDPKDVSVLIAYQKQRGPHLIIKAALYNRITGLIELVTAFNTSDPTVIYGAGKTRSGTKTHDPAWFLGQYILLAPPFFWRALQCRIRSDARFAGDVNI